MTFASNTSKKINKRSTYLSIILSFSLTILFSAYLELLGWQIIEPDFSLSESWNLSFIYGTLQTVAGASLLGVIFVLIGLIIGNKKKWTVSNYINLWIFGVFIFLLSITGLTLWAP